jgi:hypothetical protein
VKGRGKLHRVTWVVSLLVAGSVLLSGMAGAFFLHIHTVLLGEQWLSLLVLPAEAIGITIATMMAVESLTSQWQASRQFTIRGLLLFTTAFAIVLSLLTTELLLARKAGDNLNDGRIVLLIPALWGIGFTVFAIAGSIESLCFRIRSPLSDEHVRRNQECETSDWLDAPEEILQQASRQKPSRHRKRAHHESPDMVVASKFGVSVGQFSSRRASSLLPALGSAFALAVVIRLIWKWVRG